jgi:hypothetical protein
LYFFAIAYACGIVIGFEIQGSSVFSEAISEFFTFDNDDAHNSTSAHNSSSIGHFITRYSNDLHAKSTYSDFKSLLLDPHIIDLLNTINLITQNRDIATAKKINDIRDGLTNVGNITNKNASVLKIINNNADWVENNINVPLRTDTVTSAKSKPKDLNTLAKTIISNIYKLLLNGIRLNTIPAKVWHCLQNIRLSESSIPGSVVIQNDTYEYNVADGLSIVTKTKNFSCNTQSNPIDANAVSGYVTELTSTDLIDENKLKIFKAGIEFAFKQIINPTGDDKLKQITDAFLLFAKITFNTTSGGKRRTLKKRPKKTAKHQPRVIRKSSRMNKKWSMRR